MLKAGNLRLPILFRLPLLLPTYPGGITDILLPLKAGCNGIKCPSPELALAILSLRVITF